jgi:hypothetical protein
MKRGLILGYPRSDALENPLVMKAWAALCELKAGVSPASHFNIVAHWLGRELTLSVREAVRLGQTYRQRAPAALNEVSPFRSRLADCCRII